MKWLLLLCGLLIGNLTPPERHSYQEHPKLSWQDFKGTPSGSSPHRASINSGLSYTYHGMDQSTIGRPHYKVYAYFYPQLSWRRDLNETDPALLAHEQLHWDITEVYARKLRVAYHRYRPRKDPKSEMDYIFQVFEKKRKAVQDKYDLETRHGRDKEAQLKWWVAINEELFLLSEWQML